MKFQRYLSMMRQIMFIVLLLGVAVSGRAQSAASSQGHETFAQLPYHELVKIAQNDSSQPKTEDRLTFVLASRNKVPLTEIALTLELKQGVVPLPLNAEGQFSIPFSDTLMDENPLMVSNQPRGSLSLKFTVAVPELGKIDPPMVVDGRVKYQDVFQSLLTFKQAMKKVDSQFGEKGDQQLAVQCLTKGGGVTIHKQFGSRKLTAGDDNTVWLLYDARLFQENPDISVPEGTEFHLRPVNPEKKEAPKK